jgi:hypothetical protein
MNDWESILGRLADNEGMLVGEGGPPIRTVDDAKIVPVGASTGSLDVLTVAPILAAGFPFIATVVLPIITDP